MQLPIFKARASSAGALMVSPRSKTETLSKTTQSYLQDWAKEHIYGIRKQIKSKYIDKGLTNEDYAIDQAIKMLDLPFVLKNVESFEDDYFTGTPDIVTDTEVLDIKCSWDAFTFPLFAEEIPTDDYFYQLQVYMHLTGRKSARLVYVLTDTPPELQWGEMVSYQHVADKYKIKTFTVDYQPEIIDQLQQRVLAAREYISFITKNL
jgi:hypothetical protein